MIVRFVTVKLKDGYGAAFEEATTKNHRGTLSEPGALRFDVLKDATDSQTYYLYEVYRDEAATAAHKETPHYKEWRETVAPMMATDRTSITCTEVAPAEAAGWISISASP